MSHLSTTEYYCQTYLVTVLKKFADLFTLHLDIVITDFETVTDLFQFACFSVALAFGDLFRALVVEFAPVDYLCNRWIGVG